MIQRITLARWLRDRLTLCKSPALFFLGYRTGDTPPRSFRPRLMDAGVGHHKLAGAQELDGVDQRGVELLMARGIGLVVADVVVSSA